MKINTSNPPNVKAKSISSEFMRIAVSRQVRLMMMREEVLSASECAKAVMRIYPAWHFDKRKLINEAIHAASRAGACVRIG